MDRVAAARDRVRSIQAALHSPARDLPCVNCRYFEIVCTHPAASEIGVSPVSGRAKATYFDADKVRAEDGACGPEGALFDARSLPALFVVSVLTSKFGPWLLFFGAAIGLDMLLR